MTRLDDLLSALDTWSPDPDAGGASEADVAAFERELGGRLDDTYRAFLLGSGPLGVRGAADLPHKAGSALVEVLYGLGCAPDFDVSTQTLDTYAGRIPDDTIAIGEDGVTGGDLLLLAFDGARAGEVFLWHHDRPPPNVRPLTPSFTDLLERSAPA